MTPPISVGRCPVAAVTRAGMCIGCGACGELLRGKVTFVTAPDGRIEPHVLHALTAAERRQFRRVCPGLSVGPAGGGGGRGDAIWGVMRDVRLAYATDDQIRFRAATGGVLTSLGSYLLESGQVDAVLHVRPSQRQPLSSEPQLSRTAGEVLAGAGSRYTPVPSLASLGEVVAAGLRFALIGKPCDINAATNLARSDSRLRELMAYRLTIVCGGLNDIRLFKERLLEHGIDHREIAASRHRGEGCPGLVRHETRAGRVLELTYAEFYGIDEAGWRLPLRCKVCPDAIGLQADVVALDSWPGGSPRGEDEGTNLVILRTERGQDLFEAAVRDSRIVDAGRAPLPLSDYQPHHVARRQGAGPRLAGLSLANGMRLRMRGLNLARATGIGGGRQAAANFAGGWRRARAYRAQQDAPAPPPP